MRYGAPKVLALLLFDVIHFIAKKFLVNKNAKKFVHLGGNTFQDLNNKMNFGGISDGSWMILVLYPIWQFSWDFVFEIGKENCRTVFARENVRS